MSKNYLWLKVRDSFIKKKIQKVKQIVDNNKYPPKFEPEKWKKAKRGCNSYSYVLDVPVKDRLKQTWLPGVFSGKCYDGESYEALVEYLKADLAVLGFSYRENEDVLHEGEYRIAIYWIPTLHDIPIGFHISRQDEDGCWSEKPNWRSSIEVFKEKSNIPPDLSEYNVHWCETLIIKRK